MKAMPLITLMLMGTLAWPDARTAQAAGELAEAEQLAMSDTVQYALENNPSNQSSDWVNPDTGSSGGVVPVRTYTNAQGGPCREFISTIVIGGVEQQGYGTACRQPDGTWQLVADPPSTTQAPPVAAQTPIYITHPPPQYYYYPADFYYPYRIYLSFGYIYRAGHAFRGTYFLDGHSFHHRHPIHVHNRVFVSPHDPRHRHWFDRLDRGRSVDRRIIQRGEVRQVDRVWRDRDRSDDRRVWKERDRGGDRNRGSDRHRGSRDRGGRDSGQRGRDR